MTKLQFITEFLSEIKTNGFNEVAKNMLSDYHSDLNADKDVQINDFQVEVFTYEKVTRKTEFEGRKTETITSPNKFRIVIDNKEIIAFVYGDTENDFKIGIEF